MEGENHDIGKPQAPSTKAKEELKHKKAVGGLGEALYSPIPTATQLVQ